jgi:hypothetical protein
MECFHTVKNLNLEDFDHLYESNGVCKCFQPCNSIEYDTELVDFRFNDDNQTERDELMIKFKHKHSEYFPYVRYQEFKTKDFLAYVGGLLGLFAGVN